MLLFSQLDMLQTLIVIEQSKLYVGILAGVCELLFRYMLMCEHQFSQFPVEGNKLYQVN